MHFLVLHTDIMSYSFPCEVGLMPHDLCRFSYFSTPVGVDFERDIADIVAVASQRNTELGLTGVIAIENGRYHQILEGRLEDVQILMNSVAFDKRHHSLVAGVAKKIIRRSFGNWSMHQVAAKQMAQYRG
jgi:Sensors of blue-light using FAD